jgi:hypothetical protein
MDNNRMNHFNLFNHMNNSIRHCHHYSFAALTLLFVVQCSVSSVLVRTTAHTTAFSVLQSGTIVLADSSFSPDHNRGIIILKKAGFGGLLGCFFVFPGVFIGGSLLGKDGWSSLAGGLIGGYAGYIFGTSYGVHLINEEINPNTSLGPTMVSGLLSIGGVYAISTISNNSAIRGTAAIVLPIAFPIIYTELIE